MSTPMIADPTDGQTIISIRLEKSFNTNSQLSPTPPSQPTSLVALARYARHATLPSPIIKFHPSNTIEMKLEQIEKQHQQLKMKQKCRTAATSPERNENKLSSYDNISHKTHMKHKSKNYGNKLPILNLHANKSKSRPTSPRTPRTPNEIQRSLTRPTTPTHASQTISTSPLFSTSDSSIFTTIQSYTQSQPAIATLLNQTHALFKDRLICADTSIECAVLEYNDVLPYCNQLICAMLNSATGGYICIGITDRGKNNEYIH
jgi:hypothetical protein